MPKQTIKTSTRNGRPTPTLDITTAAVRNPGVTVEFEPGVSGDGREIRKKVKLLILHAGLQVYWYGITL